MESTQELAIYAPWIIHQNSCNTMFPRDMVCLRNISVDTLHKGDTEDNNNNNNNNNLIRPKWFSNKELWKPYVKFRKFFITHKLLCRTLAHKSVEKNRYSIIYRYTTTLRNMCPNVIIYLFMNDEYWFLYKMVNIQTYIFTNLYK